MNTSHAKILAEELMHNHGVGDWRFSFDRAKKRFGKCDYTKKTISLSKFLTELNSQEQVTDTILHEIAHALAGYDAGHGRKWQKIVKSIGGKAERCYISEEVVTPPLAYTLTCPKCNIVVQRQKRLRVKKKIACKACCKKYNQGKFSDQFSFVWKKNESYHQ